MAVSAQHKSLVPPRVLASLAGARHYSVAGPAVIVLLGAVGRGERVDTGPRVDTVGLDRCSGLCAQTRCLLQACSCHVG